MESQPSDSVACPMCGHSNVFAENELSHPTTDGSLNTPVAFRRCAQCGERIAVDPPANRDKPAATEQFLAVVILVGILLLMVIGILTMSP